MEDKRENRNGYMGITLFLFACFLCVFTYSDNSTCPSSYPAPIECSIGFHFNNDNACVAPDILLPSRQKSCLIIRYNANLNLFHESFKIVVDNIRINQRIAVLQKTLLLIKPSIPDRFRLHQLSADSEDPHFLS